MFKLFSHQNLVLISHNVTLVFFENKFFDLFPLKTFVSYLKQHQTQKYMQNEEIVSKNSNILH